MVLINLLPWRAQAQLYQQKQRRLMLAGAVLFGVALVMMLHVGLQLWASRLAQHLVELDTAISRLQQRHQGVVGKGETQYVQLHHQLTMYQAGTRQLVRQLNEVHAPGVCFNKIARYQGGIRFHGKTDSVQALSAFFTDWPAASHFREIRIENLKLDREGQLVFVFEGVEANHFEMSSVKRDQHSRA